MRLLVFIGLAFLSGVAHAEDTWPLRFVWKQGNEHKLVVLNKDGTAGYSARLLRPHRAEYHFVASSASWGLCRPELARTQRPLCIWVLVTGYSDGNDNPMRFDYGLLGATLTEFDKSGEETVLHRIRWDDEPWETPNTSLERTRDR